MSERIAICIPSGGDWKADFGWDLVNMTLAAPALLDRDADIMCINERGSILPTVRNKLIKHALEAEADWILMLDDDMRFPADTLTRLMAHDMDVVAANCVLRTYPCRPTAHRGRELIYTEPSSTGLERVDHVGCAVMLAKASVFEKVEKPWFANASVPGNDYECMGEDVWFCKRLRDAGVSIQIDHDLSKQIGHLGDLPYTHNMALSSRAKGLAA